MQILQEITFSYAKVQLIDKKLVRLKIFGKNAIGLEQSKEMNNAIGQLSKGKQVYVLVLADEITTFDKEALDFSASEEGMRYTLADALVVKSLTQKLTANFYLKINRPKKPSRIFNSETDAVKWLHALDHNIVPA